MIDKDKLPLCPIETTLTVIGDKWKVLVLRDLFLNKVMRLSELKKSLNGVTQKMLTQQLRAMENDGLIHREVYPVVPPKVEYSLTSLGLSLKPILDSMWSWGENFKTSIK